MENIFNSAKFGEIYLTKDGKKNSFCSFCNCNGEIVARLYREGWGLIIVQLDGKAIGGLEFGRNMDFDIIGKLKEHINKEELDRLAKESYPYEDGIEEAHWNSNQDRLREAFKAGYRKAKRNE